jgi:type IV secretory pathway VirB2 component (pilin)
MCGWTAKDHMPAADFVALISIAAVLTTAWIAGSAMSWARAFLAVITIAAMFAAAWLVLR